VVLSHVEIGRPGCQPAQDRSLILPCVRTSCPSLLKACPRLGCSFASVSSRPPVVSPSCTPLISRITQIQAPRLTRWMARAGIRGVLVQRRGEGVFPRLGVRDKVPHVAPLKKRKSSRNPNPPAARSRCLPVFTPTIGIWRVVTSCSPERLRDGSPGQGCSWW